MKDILKRIIFDFHETPLPAFRRRTLEVPLDLGKIITVIGPRRAGKTYFLYQLMADLKHHGIAGHQMLYLNFEDERLDLEGNNDVIFDAYRELYPNQDLTKVYIFFDEIQELSGWEKFIRRIGDSVSKNIFLTGSNAKLLSRKTPPL
jgi:predicted AAA+ superfamily ATPase